MVFLRRNPDPEVGRQVSTESNDPADRDPRIVLRLPSVPMVNAPVLQNASLPQVLVRARANPRLGLTLALAL